MDDCCFKPQTHFCCEQVAGIPGPLTFTFQTLSLRSSAFSLLLQTFSPSSWTAAANERGGWIKRSHFWIAQIAWNTSGQGAQRRSRGDMHRKEITAKEFLKRFCLAVGELSVQGGCLLEIMRAIRSVSHRASLWRLSLSLKDSLTGLWLMINNLPVCPPSSLFVSALQLAQRNILVFSSGHLSHARITLARQQHSVMICMCTVWQS